MNTIEELKQLVEDFVEYTRTWSISETEWYWNIACIRKSNNINNKNITSDEFERAIREEILYCFLYKINSIKQQMEIDLCVGYDDTFNNISLKMEKKIQKLFKDFKIDRS